MPSLPFCPTAVGSFTHNGVSAVGHSRSATIVEFTFLHVIQNRADGAAVEEADYASGIIGLGVTKQQLEASLDARREL